MLNTTGAAPASLIYLVANPDICGVTETVIVPLVVSSNNVLPLSDNDGENDN